MPEERYRVEIRRYTDDKPNQFLETGTGFGPTAYEAFTSALCVAGADLSNERVRHGLRDVYAVLCKGCGKGIIAMSPPLSGEFLCDFCHKCRWFEVHQIQMVKI